MGIFINWGTFEFLLLVVFTVLFASPLTVVDLMVEEHDESLQGVVVPDSLAYFKIYRTHVNFFFKFTLQFTL